MKLVSYITGQIWIPIPSTILKGVETEMSYSFTSCTKIFSMGHGRETMSTCSQPRAEIMFPSTAHIEGMNTETDTFWFVKVVGDKLLKNEKIHKKNEKSNDLFHSIRTNTKKNLRLRINYYQDVILQYINCVWFICVYLMAHSYVQNMPEFQLQY